MLSIGIDPGLKGAIVVVDEKYILIDYHDCPVIENTKTKKGKKSTKFEFAPAAMASVLRTMLRHESKHGHAKVWLERAGAMPQQGLSSTFKTGRGFGLWEGILAGIRAVYDIIAPRTWTTVMFQGTPLGEPKQRSFSKCQRLYPTLPLTAPRGRVLSLDGRSDAALIATYGMIEMTGSKPSIADRRTPVRIKR